jgi:glucose-1-phosphate cytidylyltransferase
MKVVLFCGGLGTRLRDYSENIPKPLVPIGYRPIIWHVMKYYAHFGHKDFILCLGYMADKIKDYFLSYKEYVSNDFTMTHGGKEIQLMQTDIHDWRITFVDTGLKSNIGQRLKQIEHHLEGEELFLANYTDGLTDMPLNEMIQDFQARQGIGAFVCTRPSQTFHVVTLKENGLVSNLQYVRDAGILINGGFFVFRKKIFEYIDEGEELVLQPFQRLIQKDLLLAYEYDRFWCMDTFKEQQELTDMYNQGCAPWEVWRKPGVAGRGSSAQAAERDPGTALVEGGH